MTCLPQDATAGLRWMPAQEGLDRRLWQVMGYINDLIPQSQTTPSVARERGSYSTVRGLCLSHRWGESALPKKASSRGGLGFAALGGHTRVLSRRWLAPWTCSDH